MIIQVNEDTYAEKFASVYNSANTLFREDERCDADGKLFYEQLHKDVNFVYFHKKELCGFLSYHRFEGYYELTSLYVKREHQKRKIGHQLLTYFEKQIEEDAVIMIKVLKNAPWAIDFYKKHGYGSCDAQMCGKITNGNVIQKGWEIILYKRGAVRDIICTQSPAGKCFP